jgi:hypothetical protein
VRGIPGWLTRPRLILVTAAAIAVAAGAGGTAVALGGASSPHVAAMPAGGLTRAELKVTSGTAILDVSVGKLGGTLLRVSAPDGAPVRPVLSGSGPAAPGLIVLSLAGAGPGGQGPEVPGGPPAQRQDSGYAVKVVLSAAVTWSLDLAGGTQLTKVDLRGGKVAGIAVMAGSDTLDMRLPRPAGTLPLLLAGGLSQFLLGLPAGVPAQVTVGGGASSVSLDGQHLTGIAGGTVVTSPGWAAATSRYDIDAISGFSQLAVSRWPAGGS